MYFYYKSYLWERGLHFRMIIYFSGTGNSLYAAQKLLKEKEQLVSISELMKNHEYTIELAKDEELGFVFPVYFYTLPFIVRDFVEKVEVKNASYVYSVITCGGGTGQASAVLNKLLKTKGIQLAYFKELLMPDNSMLFYQIPGVEKAESVLARANKELENIRDDISSHKSTDMKTNTVISEIMGWGYNLCSKTSKFYSNDKCTGCGLCERNCPEQVIKMVENRPVWEKESCGKCSSCINRCPVQAIQYGKGTVRRNRYVNPYV